MTGEGAPAEDSDASTTQPAQLAGDTGLCFAADCPLKRSKLVKRGVRTPKSRTRDCGEDSIRSNSSDRASVASRRKRSSHRKVQKLPADDAHHPSLVSVLAALGKEDSRDIKTPRKHSRGKSGEHNPSTPQDTNASASSQARTAKVHNTVSHEQFVHMPLVAAIPQPVAAAIPRAQRSKKGATSASTPSHGKEPDGASPGGVVQLAPAPPQLSTGDATDLRRCAMFPMNPASPATSPWPYNYIPDYVQAYAHAAPAWSGYVHGTSSPPWSPVCASPNWSIQSPNYPLSGFSGFSQAPPVHHVPGLGASEWYLQQFRMLTLQNQAAASVLYSMLPVIADLSKGDASKKAQVNSAPNLLHLEHQTQSEMLPPATVSASTQWTHPLESKATQSSPEYVSRAKTESKVTWNPLESKATQSSLEYVPRVRTESKDASTLGSISETTLAAPGKATTSYLQQTMAQQTEPPHMRSGSRVGRVATKTVERSCATDEHRKMERELVKSGKQESTPGSPVAKRQHMDFAHSPPAALPIRRSMAKAVKKLQHTSKKTMLRGFSYRPQVPDAKTAGYCINPPVYHGAGYPPASPFVSQHLTVGSVPQPTVMNRPATMPQAQLQQHHQQQHYHQQQVLGHVGPQHVVVVGSPKPSPPTSGVELATPQQKQQQPPPLLQQQPHQLQQPSYQLQPQINYWRRPFLTLQRAFKDSAASNKEEQQQQQQHAVPQQPSQRTSQMQHPQMQHPQMRAPSPQTLLHAKHPEMQQTHLPQQQFRLPLPTQHQPDASRENNSEYAVAAIARMQRATAKKQKQRRSRDRGSSVSSSSSRGTVSERPGRLRRGVAPVTDVYLQRGAISGSKTPSRPSRRRQHFNFTEFRAQVAARFPGLVGSERESSASGRGSSAAGSGTPDTSSWTNHEAKREMP